MTPATPPAPAARPPRGRCANGRRRRRRGGFTLIEVLATLLLLAIFIPVAMMATTQSMKMADVAKRKATAAGLAESKVAELVATGDWQTGNLSGVYGDDYPGFSWSATVGNWSEANLQELDVAVYWGTGPGDTGASVTLSTLVYVSNAAATGTGTTGAGTAGGSTP